MSVVRDILTASFDKEVKRIFKDRTEMQNFILNHERKNLCIENMLEAIRGTEKVMAKLSKDDIIYVGKSYAQTFCKAAVDYAERQAMTQLQKDVELRKAQERKEVDDLFLSDDRSIEL